VQSTGPHQQTSTNSIAAAQSDSTSNTLEHILAFRVVRFSPAASNESGCNLARAELVNVAPDPRFPGLDRPNQRVFAVMKVFGGVLVLG
jgi:hypothetical protein